MITDFICKTVDREVKLSLNEDDNIGRIATIYLNGERIMDIDFLSLFDTVINIMANRRDLESDLTGPGRRKYMAKAALSSCQNWMDEYVG